MLALIASTSPVGPRPRPADPRPATRQPPTTPDNRPPPFPLGRCAVGHALTGPMCHRPVGMGPGGRGGLPVSNRVQRRTRRVPAGLPAVTITGYVIRTRCLAAPAARG